MKGLKENICSLIYFYKVFNIIIKIYKPSLVRLTEVIKKHRKNTKYIVSVAILTLHLNPYIYSYRIFLFNKLQFIEMAGENQNTILNMCNIILVNHLQNLTSAPPVPLIQRIFNSFEKKVFGRFVVVLIKSFCELSKWRTFVSTYINIYMPQMIFTQFDLEEKVGKYSKLHLY